MTAGAHPTETDRRRRALLLRLAPPTLAAAMVTGSVVAVAVGQHGADAGAAVSLSGSGPAAVAPRTVAPAPAVQAYRIDRTRTFSRSAERVTLRAKPKVVRRLFRTAPLNLWPAPREHGDPLTVLPEGGRVAVTGARRAGFAQMLYRGQVRWVNATYLARHLPKPATASPEPAPDSSSPASSGGMSGVTSAPCPDGSGTEAGLTPRAVTLFRSVCNAFPALTTYGGYDAHGEHSSGRAIDFMVGDPSLGQAVADWARAHASELDLYDVIWAQHIWTPVRASEGWRLMPDRGSATANHYDHVHISVN